MADDQEPSNDVGENGGEQEISDYDDATAPITDAVVIGDSTTARAVDDYDDDAPIEDYVVKMVVDEQPDGAILDAAVTDINGNVISQTTKISDAINSYTTSIYDELNANSTAIAGGKRWWGKFIGQENFWGKSKRENRRKTGIYVCA